MTLCLTGRCHNPSRGSVDADWWQRDKDINTEARKESWADLEWNHPQQGSDQQRQTKHTCGLWSVADLTCLGALGPKTCLLWQLITLLKSRTRPMDHLPPASSQPKDSGSSSSFTQEGAQQSDSVRWCVKIRVTNERLSSYMTAENCQYTII